MIVINRYSALAFLSAVGLGKAELMARLLYRTICRVRHRFSTDAFPHSPCRALGIFFKECWNSFGIVTIFSLDRVQIHTQYIFLD